MAATLRAGLPGSQSPTGRVDAAGVQAQIGRLGIMILQGAERN